MPQGDFGSETQLKMEPSVRRRCGSPSDARAPLPPRLSRVRARADKPSPRRGRTVLSRSVSQLRPPGQARTMGGVSSTWTALSPTRWSASVSPVHQKLKIQRVLRQRPSGRRTVWDGLGPSGVRRLSRFSGALELGANCASFTPGAAERCRDADLSAW